MPEDAASAEEFPSPRDRAFGDLVVEMGLTSRRTVDEALALQVRYAFSGQEPPPLPQILVARRSISHSQAERVLGRLAEMAAEGRPGLAPDAGYSAAQPLPAFDGDLPAEASGPVIIPPGAPAAPAKPPPPPAPRITYPTDTGTVEIIMPTGGFDGATTASVPSEPPAAAAPPPPPSTTAAPGEPIKGYRLLARVSQDETGAIFKARQNAMDRNVMLKILPPGKTADPAFIERFLAEARDAGQLNHPNLTRVHEIGRTGNYYFYSMEMVEGRSLEDNVKLGGRMEVRRALRLALEIARAVEHMAAKGLVHGDISPQTVTITNEGIVKLSLAGLGGSKGATRLLSGDRCRYAAPERLKGGRVDSRADIYSAGGVLYYALTGQHPFSGLEAAEILGGAAPEGPPDPRGAVAEIPAAAAKAVIGAMARDPKDRFRTPAELVAALEAAQGALPSRVTTTGPKASIHPRSTQFTRHIRYRRR